MQELFSKQRTHKELVQRTEKLLCLLMSLEQLTDEDRELIWRTTDMNDVDMRVEILKSLTGAANDMLYADRRFFVGKVVCMPAEETTDRHIDLVKEICSTGRDDPRSSEIAQQGLEFMWSMMFKVPGNKDEK